MSDGRITVRLFEYIPDPPDLPDLLIPGQKALSTGHLHPASRKLITRPGKDPKRSRMCGRYSLICIDDLGNRFRVFDPMMGSRSRFNIAPGNEMPVIVRAGENHVAIMRWGLIPSWTKDIRAAKPMINARAETLEEKPAFRCLLKAHRCLIPASGFFEWKKERNRKIPYYIWLKDEPLFSFAGLFDQWHNPGGVIVSTYTIITCEANSLVAPIHNRMPVILSRADEARWLAPDPITHEDLKQILVPFLPGRMDAMPVSDRVNNPAIDDERLVRPLFQLT